MEFNLFSSLLGPCVSVVEDSQTRNSERSFHPDHTHLIARSVTLFERLFISFVSTRESPVPKRAMRQSSATGSGSSASGASRHSHVGQLIGQLGQSALMWRSFHTTPSSLRSSNVTSASVPVCWASSSSQAPTSSTATSLYVPSTGTGGPSASLLTYSSLRHTVRPWLWSLVVSRSTIRVALIRDQSDSLFARQYTS